MQVFWIDRVQKLERLTAVYIRDTRVNIIYKALPYKQEFYIVTNELGGINKNEVLREVTHKTVIESLCKTLLKCKHLWKN